jgi:hypothetical protein
MSHSLLLFEKSPERTSRLMKNESACCERSEPGAPPSAASLRAEDSERTTSKLDLE